jgi:hypothetical protein
MDGREYHGERLPANAQAQQPAEKPALGMVEQTADTGFTGACVPYAAVMNIANVRTTDESSFHIFAPLSLPIPTPGFGFCSRRRLDSALP